MKELLKGTRTEANLRSAFSGESKARNRYSYYSEIAKSEGYDIIAKFFEDTANNEKAHAKAWYKLLNGNILPNTQQSLEEAIKGEYFEHTEMYPQFAQIAREEGFETIATLFEGIAEVEKKHEQQFQKVLESLSEGKELEFRTPDTTCLNCGHDFTKTENVDKCPICESSSAFFIQKHQE
ncbi:MAG: rubrerythrin family protein [Defluviitaleaceae bacterium]|nr:rubrerythrin family protein [Defluviitaleaceae bacterium]